MANLKPYPVAMNAAMLQRLTVTIHPPTHPFQKVHPVPRLPIWEDPFSNFLRNGDLARACQYQGSQRARGLGIKFIKLGTRVYVCMKNMVKGLGNTLNKKMRSTSKTTNIQC